MKKKTKQEVTKEREDECFSCGDGGQIVSCKKPGCPKVYHADCLNLAKRPAGKQKWKAGLVHIRPVLAAAAFHIDRKYTAECSKWLPNVCCSLSERYFLLGLNQFN